MPICTYLSDMEYEMFKTITDKELNELFQEIRIKHPNLLLEEYNIPRRVGFFKQKIKLETYYTIYHYLGCSEAQIINFQQGTRIDSNTVYAYFYGLLG